MTEWMNAIIMGIVEGGTEFLPVSSTGHLLMMKEILGFTGPQGNVFEIVIQFGAIMAIVVLYFQRLWHVLMESTKNPNAQRFIGAVLVAFLPAAFIGFFAHDFIKEVLFNPTIVAVMFILGGIAILVIEKKAPQPQIDEVEHMPMKTALMIGFYQCLAMVPGVSRSGATIMGSLLLKVERRAAAEFSFFLAIPTMVGATVYDLYKNADHLSMDDGALIAVGTITAFITALIVVKAFVGYVTKHGFAPFAWYRIAAGIIALVGLHLV